MNSGQNKNRPRSARDEGSTIVEAALTLPIFLFIMVSATNLAILSYRAAGLYYTLTATARWAVLGQSIGGQTRVLSIKQKAQEIGKIYGLQLPTSNIHVCAVGATSCSPESAGTADSYIQVSATEPAALFLGMYSVNLSYSALGRNEPFRKKLNGSAGAAMIELAITLPVLLSLSLGSLEFARAFKTQQVISAISREGGNAAFRDCSPITSANNCLAGVYSIISTYAQSVLPGAEVVISIYDYNPAGANVVTQPATISLRSVQGLSPSTGATAGGNKSHFTPQPLDGQNPNPPTDLFRSVLPAQFQLTSLTNSNRTIAVAEVFYTFTPAVTAPRLDYFHYFTSNMYEAAIF